MKKGNFFKCDSCNTTIFTKCVGICGKGEGNLKDGIIIDTEIWGMCCLECKSEWKCDSGIPVKEKDKK